jgi:methylmalonyl-CoA/ethylmalonyl-CoA epimerase
LSMASKAAKELGLGKFMQIGFVVKNTEKVLEYYEKTLGLGHFDTMVGNTETEFGKARVKFSFAQVGGIQFEIIEVVEGETVYSPFLKQGLEGLHHLGFYVDDIDKKLKELRQKGIKVLARGRALGGEYAYLDTASISGVIFELIQVHLHK